MTEWYDHNAIPGGVYSNWHELLIRVPTAADFLNAVARFIIPIVVLTMLTHRWILFPMWVGIFPWLGSEIHRAHSFLFTLAVEISRDTLFVRDFIDSNQRRMHP